MVSIIIPAYNSESFLEKCVISVCNQTYSDLEIILVDDGSKDRSPLICDELAAKDKRIRVIHKENGGVSSARNMGLNIAQGEYIMFVDSDDWIAPGFIASFFIAGANQADIVIGGYTELYKGGETVHTHKTEVLEKAKFGQQFEMLYSENLTNAPFSKLYKRSVIGSKCFDAGVALGEDFLFNLKVFRSCTRFMMVEAADYFYNCLNENSATKRFRKSDIPQIAQLYTAGKDFLEECGVSQTTHHFLEKRLCLNGINVLQLLFYSDLKNKKALAYELLENETFHAVCELEYQFPMKYEVPRILCRSKRYTMLKAFYKCKKVCTGLSKRVHVENL